MRLWNEEAGSYLQARLAVEEISQGFCAASYADWGSFSSKTGVHQVVEGLIGDIITQQWVIEEKSSGAQRNIGRYKLEQDPVSNEVLGTC